MTNVPLISLGDIREILKEHRKQKVKQGLSGAAARFVGRKNWEYKLKHKLENAIPTGGKYKVSRRMARLFDYEKSVKNYKLIQCFIPIVKGNNDRLRKFSEKDYKNRKFSHKDDEKLKNHFKMLNKFWKNIGYAARFGKYHSKIVLIKPVVDNDKNKLDITSRVI